MIGYAETGALAGAKAGFGYAETGALAGAKAGFGFAEAALSPLQRLQKTTGIN